MTKKMLSLCTPASILLLFLTACTHFPTISASFNGKEDFSSMKTYRWMENSPRPTANQHPTTDDFDAKVVSALDNALLEAGFQPALPPEKPDFLVGYHVGLRTQLDVRAMNAHYNYPTGWAWDQYYPSFNIDNGNQRRTIEVPDCVVVDIAHPQDGRLIWRGAISGKLVRSGQLDDGARQLLILFPPR